MIINPIPIGTIAISPCPNCLKPLTSTPFTDGIIEAAGIEPYKWTCYNCEKRYKNSEVMQITLKEV